MRGLTLVLAGGLTLMTSAQGAPFAPNLTAIEVGATPPLELVRDGCGRGWHRTRWRDQWGNWQWGHCIPNGGSHDAWSAGWNYPSSDWRAVLPRWGWGNP